MVSVLKTQGWKAVPASDHKVIAEPTALLGRSYEAGDMDRTAKTRSGDVNIIRDAEDTGWSGTNFGVDPAAAILQV